MPRTKRKIGSCLGGLTQSCGAVQEEIIVAGVGYRGHFAERNNIAITQCAPLKSTKIRSQIRGTAAYNNWHIDSAWKTAIQARQPI